MQFQLITPESILFSGEAEQILMPGKEGVFGVLPGHAPLVAALKEGVISIELADKTQKRVVILSGLAEVTADKAVVLAETAEDCSGLTAAQAEASLQDAKRQLDSAVSEEEMKTARRRL
ncbi:MAG: ATP synthase F1 subunit epsilon, partial [Alphaproteobacteria bacterium]